MSLIRSLIVSNLASFVLTTLVAVAVFKSDSRRSNRNVNPPVVLRALQLHREGQECCECSLAECNWPDLMDCGSTVDLSEQGLTGTIPTTIGLATQLTFLRLSNNELAGTVPTEIGLLTGLTGLDVHGNFLSARIPSELGQLMSLTELYLHFNFFASSLPTELGFLAAITDLDISDNQLTGMLPSELGLLTLLTKLGLILSNAARAYGCPE